MECKFPPDNFCFVCGNFIESSMKINLSVSPTVCEAYEAYFGLTVGPRRRWTPNCVCKNCRRTLIGKLVEPKRNPVSINACTFVLILTNLKTTEHLPITICFAILFL